MENKITPFIWFNKDLKEVTAYYSDIFNKDGKTQFEEIMYKAVLEAPEPTEMATVKLFGNIYHFMGATRPFSFNESVSFMINTDDQAETDYYWDALTREGTENVCGWCTDKYGLSWQVTPKRLLELTTSEDKEVTMYAMQQMMNMKKIIIKDLEK